MTFDSLETGIATGKPVRLYLFERHGPITSMRWAYNTSDRDIEYEGVTYIGLGASDDGIRQTGETSADAIVITAAGNIEVAQPWRSVAPSAEIHVTVFDLQYAELLARVRWIGSIAGVNWPQPDRCAITCHSLSASMEKTGLRETWACSCTKTLYQCGVAAAAFRVTAAIDALGTLYVDVAAADGYVDGWFTGGYVEWDIAPGIAETRGIERHIGARLQLLDLTSGLSVGQSVRIYPGCDRTLATCDSKFGNLLNSGASPYMPGKSPFAGDPIF